MSSSLNGLNLSKDHVKYLNQEFDNVLDLVQQKTILWLRVYDFVKFKEEWPSKETFYSSLTAEILLTKSMNLFLMFGKNWNKNEERL